MPIEPVMPSSHLVLCHPPLLLLPSLSQILITIVSMYRNHMAQFEIIKSYAVYDLNFCYSKLLSIKTHQACIIARMNAALA